VTLGLLYFWQQLRMSWSQITEQCGIGRHGRIRGEEREEVEVGWLRMVLMDDEDGDESGGYRVSYEEITKESDWRGGSCLLLLI
jgi:hypothetical protein